MSTVRRSSCK